MVGIDPVPILGFVDIVEDPHKADGLDYTTVGRLILIVGVLTLEICKGADVGTDEAID